MSVCSNVLHVIGVLVMVILSLHFYSTLPFAVHFILVIFTILSQYLRDGCLGCNVVLFSLLWGIYEIFLNVFFSRKIKQYLSIARICMLVGFSVS